MAFRRATKWAQDQDGPVVGGTGYEGRLYVAGTATLATLYLDSGGSFSLSNPHSPNAGLQTSSTANMLTTDDSITVTSTTGFAVGDMLPIDGSAGRFYGVVRTVTDSTHLRFTQTLAAMGGAATMNSGALVGGPEMYGHWQAYAADTTDYDFTLKSLATAKEGPPEGLAMLQTAATIAVQEEGSTVSTRGTMNFISPFVTATDNGGSNRADITGPTSATPAIVLSTAAAGGSATTIIRSDSTIAAFDSTAPVTQAFGDTAATGSIAFAARRDHKHGMPTGLSTATAALSADVTIVNASTYYDGPSVSLGAGTWQIVGAIVVSHTTNADVNVTAKLWDGTTVISSGETQVTYPGVGGGGHETLPVMGIVSPGSTTTYKISAASNTGGSTVLIKAAAPDNGAGNNASYIAAVKVST